MPIYMAQDLKSYLAALPSLSKVKDKLLRKLWASDGSPFPKPWVTSSTLLALSGQKYFDRRIRELRDEYGCDIETHHINGEHCYRIVSHRMKPAKHRGYLSEADKKALFVKYKSQCQICGKKVKAGVRGLQVDHKIPLLRGGQNNPKNAQPICNECNVGKKTACKDCQDDCKKCPWAFPERVGKISLFRLPPNILDSLHRQVGDDHGNIERKVISLLKSGLGIK